MPMLATRAAASVRGFGFGSAVSFRLTISTNQSNLNLRTYALANGWDGVTNLVATINGGVTISSTSTATPALTISGSFPGGVSLVNNGLIYGRGGAGGNGGTWSGPSSFTNGVAGSAGGVALSVAVAVSVTNNGTIGGGGGGGGGGGAANIFNTYYCGGGGGGGGIGVSAGGGGGAITYGTPYPGTAGGDGTISSAGGGGAGGLYSAPYYGGGAGGSGGGRGAAGGTGVTTPVGYATTYTFGASGGSAGGSVSGNSNITWVATGTRLGPIT